MMIIIHSNSRQLSWLHHRVPAARLDDLLLGQEARAASMQQGVFRRFLGGTNQLIPSDQPKLEKTPNAIYKLYR